MAIAISSSCFLTPKSPSPPNNFFRPSIPPQNLRMLRRRISAQENNDGGASETLADKKEQVVAKEEDDKAEIRRIMDARKDDMLGGVAEEVREIEWPVFGKVVGTTGVVVAVIAGSSVVLLTVNAVLAELSDRVFAGKGVQDFFS